MKINISLHKSASILPEPNIPKMIVEDILNVDGSIMGVSIMSKEGNILSSYGTDALAKKFEVDRYDDTYGLWANVILHKGSILMLIPIKSNGGACAPASHIC